MRQTELYQRIGICSVLHLMVDGLCLCCLFLLAPALPPSRLVGVFLTYNLLAFLSQPFTGMVADRIRRPHWMLLASVLLLNAAVLASAFISSAGISSEGTWLVATLLGLGNSLFHVWGGKQVATASLNDMRSLGTFVSTGAFGLSLGYVFFSWHLLCFFLLSISALSVVYITIDKESPNTTNHPAIATWQFGLPAVFLATFALMAAVMLRSYSCEAFTGGMTKTSTTILLVGIVAMLGKMSGGWLARRFGIVAMLSVVLSLSLLCFLFRGSGVGVLLLGLLMLNSTMPVTLYLANVVLPTREGLAFGLLAAALIPGYLLATL